MSNAMAIAAVTSVMQKQLSEVLSADAAIRILGNGVKVSVLPPDRVVRGTEVPQLNLFLHQVTTNAGWCNQDLPSRDATGLQRLSQRPLAIDLHYLLSAYSAADLQGEILLGLAMQELHERPEFSRSRIRALLDPPSSPPKTALGKALAASGLDDQIERIRITPELLSSEELTKLWSATLSNFRPSTTYRASVVLIQTDEPVRAPLPVLSRGRVVPGLPTGSLPGRRRETGVAVQATMEPAVPTLTAVLPVDGQPMTRLGATIELQGHHLEGSKRFAVLSNDRFRIDAVELKEGPPDPADDPARTLRFQVPVSRAADFPVGIYRVGVRMERTVTPAVGPASTEILHSNDLALVLAPEITGLPTSVLRDASGAITFTVKFQPDLRPGQQVMALVGGRGVKPKTLPSDSTDKLEFLMKNAELTPPGEPGHLVRLRIDGIESPSVDRTKQPPEFLDKRVVVT